MYSVAVFAPNDYPTAAPQVRFVEPKIKMPAVGSDGAVDLSKLEPKFSWTPDKNIADVLMAIRENMYKESVYKASAALQGSSY
jgi:ubiquitin-protein ligase